jgi:hypothetical protein
MRSPAIACSPRSRRPRQPASGKRSAERTSPDVIQMDYRYLSEYGKRNMLLDLGK